MKEKIKKGIYITKLEAATRQLDTAVIIWFNNGDPVSIHTLASASYQILYDLNKHQKSPLIMTPDSDLIKPEYQKEWKRTLKAAANFMKHADSDPAGTLSFNPEINEHILFDSIVTYSMLTNETRPIPQCFFMWFVFAHPDLFFKEYIAKVSKVLPINYFKDMNRTEFFQYALPVVTRSIISNK